MRRPVRPNLRHTLWAINYMDEKYFSRIFKKVIGKTPSEYKKRDR